MEMANLPIFLKSGNAETTYICVVFPKMKSVNDGNTQLPLHRNSGMLNRTNKFQQHIV